MDKKYHLWNILIACDTIITRVQGSAGRHVWLDPCLEPELRTRYRGGRVSMAVQCPWRCHDAGIPARTWHFVCRFSGSVGIHTPYSAYFGPFLPAPAYVGGLLSIGHSRLSLALYDALHSLVFLFSYLAVGKPHLQSLERIAFASRCGWRFSRWHWWWYGTRHGWQYTRRHWRWYC